MGFKVFMNKVLFALALSLILLISGCSFSKYYEFEEGVFCLDDDGNELCDKDEPEEVELDSKNLYEFEDGKFCIDVDKNKVCDEDEETEDEPKEDSVLGGKVVDNSTGEIPDSDKTEHELCLEKYDIEPGTVIHRYATWDPFRDDSSADQIEEVGYLVYKDRIGVDAKETYDASDLMKECFAGAYTEKDFLPPEYICSSNKDHIKDSSYADLRTFAEDCQDAAVV